MLISISGLLAIAVIAAAVKVWAEYRSDMLVALARVHGKSDIIPWLYGDIEYTEGGGLWSRGENKKAMDVRRK